MSAAPALDGVAGLLLDLDGTVYQDGALLPGVPEAVERLRGAGLPLRFVTNTTRTSRRGLAARLAGLGLPLSDEELFPATVAAAAWLEAHGLRRVSLLLEPAAREDFAAFTADDERPEALVVGDLGEGWTWPLLQRAFRQLLSGARLLAVQRNRYWQGPDGLCLDAGPFVVALEYAAGVEATVVGKPSAAFFAAAARSLGLPLARLLMVGDDVAGDVGGAQAAGARGALVRTGKYRSGDESRGPVRPDLVLDGLADLPAALGRGSGPER